MSEFLDPSYESDNELGLNNFLVEYGHTLKNEYDHTRQLDAEVIRNLWEDANAHYGVLPQHNFLHAKTVLWEAMRLADSSEAHNKTVNRNALFLATLYHDTGLNDEAKPSQRSDEWYSANLMVKAGMMYGHDKIKPSTLQIAANIILASNADRVPLTIEEKIMVRADLINVRGDYWRDFLGTTARLWREHQNKPAHMSEKQFIASSITLLATYLYRDLSLWPGEPKDWLQKSIHNIKLLAADEAAQNGQSTLEYLQELDSEAVQDLLIDSPLAA